MIIIGNYTALVGDPSGRDETRAKLTESQVAANARDYLKQVGRLIDLGRAEVHHNGDWFSRWSFLDVLELTRKMTMGQITAREDFAKRIAAEKPVYLHECLYPLMQGWDSVEIRADVELGGTEQLFSLLVARDLQQGQGQEPQVALTMPILVGTDGVRRMGKSLGNYIGVGESAENQFGKIMSVPDEPMQAVFHAPDRGSARGGRSAAGGRGSIPETPRKFWARRSWPSTTGTPPQTTRPTSFADGPPAKTRTRFPKSPSTRASSTTEGRLPAFILVKELGLETSTSNARRVIEQGGVSISLDSRREPVTDPKLLVYVRDGLIVRVGKRKIACVRLV